MAVRFAQPAGAPPADIPGLRVVRLDESAWELEVTGPLGGLLERLHGLAVADIDVQRSSLEDYVLDLYSKR